MPESSNHQSHHSSSHKHQQPDVMPSLTSSTNGAGRIGRYQIIKTLGEGSFGKVKLAYHLATHARVALKIINRKTLAKSDMQGRVEREISYLRLLRHPHIIKLYDVIKSKDEIIMVIEFAGKELFDYIVQRGCMSEDEARRFFQQIISAVDYCHRHKIVHRDLKPENLLLDDNLNVKIADFGLSNIMTDGNFLKTSCGSPNYAAPEVISGKLYAGPEVDVWSCGVILYVMLCGRLPFDDEFIPNLFQKISNGVYSIPPTLSPGAKNLLKRMLVVNPLDRITVREIIQDPWFSVNLDPSLLPPDMREEQERKKEEESSSAPSSTGIEAIDDSLVGALGRTMGYSKEQVYDALRHTNGDGSEIRDAYQLVKDNRLMGSAAVRQGEMDRYLVEDSSTEDARIKQQKYQQMLAQQQQMQLSAQASGTGVPPHQLSPMSAGLAASGSGATSGSGSSSSTRSPSASFSRDNPPALTFDRMQLPSALDIGSHRTPHTTIAVLPTSLPAYHRANMIAYGPPTMRRLNPVSTKKSKTRWHFGIRSRSYPLDVMGEIYRALKNLGAEWAVPSEEDLWTIHVRWKCVLPKTVKRRAKNSTSSSNKKQSTDPKSDALTNNDGSTTPITTSNTDSSVATEDFDDAMTDENSFNNKANNTSDTATNVNNNDGKTLPSDADKMDTSEDTSASTNQTSTESKSSTIPQNDSNSTATEQNPEANANSNPSKLLPKEQGTIDHDGETIMKDNEDDEDDLELEEDYEEGEEKTELMKMRIQLYQIEQNNYLVDFKFDGWEEKPENIVASAAAAIAASAGGNSRPTSGNNTAANSRSNSTSGSKRPSVSNPSINLPPSLQMAKVNTPSNNNNDSTNTQQPNPAVATSLNTAAARSAAASVCRDKSEFDTFSAYPFLHLATRLIMELAVNSQAQ